MPPGSSAVSVIVTVRDERDAIGALLDSLVAQEKAPAEVIVVDGGSTDGTLEELRVRSAIGDLPLRVIELPGANISCGRNAAVAAAAGPLVASTDAGVRLHPTWLSELTEPMSHGARFVAGFFASDPKGAFETALGAATLPETRDVDPSRFLPSSRSVAFRKDDFAAVGGYPEWLDYCEDLIFDIRLRALVGAPAFAPRAVAFFRPRADVVSFARQYYRYARGDGKAGLWRRRHAVRYFVYLFAAPMLTAAAVAIAPHWWLALVGGAMAMTWRPYRRLRAQWAALAGRQRVLALAWVPAIRVVGDLAKMVGYPVGVFWRLRHRPPCWRPARQEAGE